MKKSLIRVLILHLLAAVTASSFAQEHRKLQYKPTADGYISCQNGKNLYTRALYGGESLWRLETSDMPVFAAYHKTDNRNISLSVKTPRGTVLLDTVAQCNALYRGGERIYRLSDPKWDKGSLVITVVACPDSESAIWQIAATNMPKGSTINAYVYATTGAKLSRSGDLGVDPREGFAAHPDRVALSECSVGIAGRNVTKYIMYDDRTVTSDSQLDLEKKYQRAQSHVAALVSKLKINTPDAYINTLGPSLAAAADGIWDGTSYQHGAVGWRMPLGGWRGAYTGDFLGWHDRARAHFDAYAASQVTDVPVIYPHPAQDSTKNIARSEKRWGTPMYSNGYICRNPNRNDQMHHYDMNLCYIDELLWHIKWTGDLDYARRVWPVITSSLRWEKTNFDPDDDGLYDAYCCIWASDALYYNSGAVTHSSAYNYRANKIAAEIASLIGEDPKPYADEADKILNAINATLWIPEKGIWAEYKDNMGRGMVHDHPGLWTFYHAIDSDIADPQQAYSAADYVINCLPHIPVKADGLDDGGYAVISTTDWLPYSWSINNVAFAEMYHTALALWQARRNAEAFGLLKSAMLDGMFIGDSPGNIGQVSYYDAARGECYRDFADPVGVLSRALVQGLFGFNPDALIRTVTITPGWPSGWQFASVSHDDFSLDFKRESASDTYNVNVHLPWAEKVRLNITPMRDNVKSIKVNGEDASWSLDTLSVGMPLLVVDVPSAQDIKLDIEWDGSHLAKTVKVKPQFGEPYRQLSQGIMKWMGQTTAIDNSARVPALLGTEPVTSASGDYAAVDISTAFNACVTDIFRNSYLSPRSPYTTLQIPSHGMGEWCHPTDTAQIDDAALRACGGTLKLPNGMTFLTPSSGQNVAFVSLWDNYPDSLELPLSGNATAVNILLAGSTNHMQCYADNAWIDVMYADGGSERLTLTPPYNWCPIEQVYYTDGKAFSIPTAQPYRLTLADGVFSRDLSAALSMTGPEGQRVPGGAATLLSVPVDATRPLASLKLTAVANDVVVGILGVTLTK